MPDVINLAEKYSKKIVDKFYTDSVILGKTSKEYDWDGVKSISVYTIQTVAPVDYLRPYSDDVENHHVTGASLARYGSTTEVQDTIQTMTLTQDKSVSLSVDKGNNTQQMLIKNAGVVMARELREQFVPMFDKYALGKWVIARGGTTVQTSLTKDNIVEEIFKHVTNIRNAGADVNDAYCYIGETNFAKLLLAKEFINFQNPAFGERNLERGVMGKVRGLQIVPVPDNYLQASANSGADGKNPLLTADVQFATIKKSVVLTPTKIKDAKVHQNPQGISGALMEIRWLYDAFVLETRNKGVQVCFASAVSGN